MLTYTSPKAKTWWEDLWRRVMVVVFVFVAVVVPIAFFLTVSKQLQAELLWVAFIASIIGAPLFLRWRERADYEAEDRKEASACMSEIQNLTEKSLANSLLLESAGKASAVLDSFSGWLLGGFAAAVTLFLTQLASLTKYIPLTTIRFCLFLFIASVIVALIAKYISSTILAASQSGAVARELLTKAPFNKPDLNLEVILSEMERAVFFPMRLLVRRSYAKIRQGDLAASARNFVRWGQIQGFLVLLQAILLLWAISAILSGIKLFVEK